MLRSPFLDASYVLCPDDSCLQGTCSYLYQLDARMSYPCGNEQGRANGTAHTSEDYRVLKRAVTIADDLTTDWRARQCCKSCNGEDGACANADFLNGGDLSAQRWCEANASTRSNTEKGCKDDIGGITSCRQP